MGTVNEMRSPIVPIVVEIEGREGKVLRTIEVSLILSRLCLECDYAFLVKRTTREFANQLRA